jgi:hypothetical protein
MTDMTINVISSALKAFEVVRSVAKKTIRTSRTVFLFMFHLNYSVPFQSKESLINYGKTSFACHVSFDTFDTLGIENVIPDGGNNSVLVNNFS